MRLFNLIFAKTLENGIGFNNKIPWHDSDDLKNFKKVTEGHIIIMGKNTHDSIGKDLPNRVNMIVTRYRTFEFIMQILSKDEYKDKTIFVIGGALLYNYCIERYSHLIDKVYITLITHKKYQCDCFITQIHEEEKYNVIQEFYTSLHNRITEASQHNEDEQNYLDLIHKIIHKGNKRSDRTGIGTLSLFAEKLEFDLRDNRLPLFTTKFVSFKNILVELLWFIKGSCSLDYLHEHGCKIWDANVKAKGQLGPMYPMQWRRCGANYIHDDVDCKEGGIDQLRDMIKLIRTDPHSRRILISNYDVANLDKMCLNPCHVLFQVYVTGRNNEYLEGIFYMRSSDTILGLPYNVCSYAILLHTVAYLTGKKATRLVAVLADAHVYLNHINAAMEQVSRTPRNFPTLHLEKGELQQSIDIDELDLQNFKLYDYHHLGKLSHSTPMAV